MPFGMGAEESIVLVIAALFLVAPIVGYVWAFRTLASIRRDQTEILARLKKVEARLKP